MVTISQPGSGQSPVDYTDFEHTGLGTLAGRYMRMFWHPIYRSEDLPNGWAVPIRVMSEDFTLYRGEGGTAHLVGFRCAHRGTQLSSGWVEDDCIRCRYHGWKYDGSGQCVEQPLEDPSFAAKIRIAGYPVEEYLGLIFVYLGEGDPPPLPRYPAMEGEGVLEVDVITRASNWANQIENDTGHGVFTHRPASFPKGVFYLPVEPVAVRETEFAVENASKYPDGEVRIAYNWMPNVQHMKAPPNDPEFGWRTTVLWWVPINDEQYMQLRVDLTPATGDAARRYREGRQAWRAKGGKEFAPEISQAVLEGKFRLDDLERERPDINITRIQDDVTLVGQGVIRDRTQEYLGRSDAQVVLWRQIWKRELRALGEGRPLKQWWVPEDLVVTDGPRRDRERLKGIVKEA